MPWTKRAVLWKFMDMCFCSCRPYSIQHLVCLETIFVSSPSVSDSRTIEADMHLYMVSNRNRVARPFFRGPQRQLTLLEVLGSM